MPHRLVAAILAVLAAVLPAASAGAQEPARGGSLQWAVWPEPPGVMAGLFLQSSPLLVTTKMFDSLLRYDFALTPQPNLAESWTIAPDGKKYTFKLQRNVRWHDGRPFTADDVVFTYGEFLIEVHPRARQVFQRAKVVKIDDHTVEFRLAEPFAPFIQSFNLCCLVVPAHLYKGTDFRKNPHNATPVGTGPFKFKEWKRGEYVHLVRNPDYWRKGLPYLDEIYFRFVPDAASRALALESQQIHFGTQNAFELIDANRLAKLPYIDVTRKGWEWDSAIAWIEMNVRKAPFSDKRFRQAVMHALDRAFLRDNVWLGWAKIATGPVHSVTPFYEPNVRQYAFDPARAEALLDEMGLKRGPGGTRTTVKLLGLPYGELWNRAAEYTRQALRTVGLEVVLEPADAAGWSDRTRNWDFDMTMYYLSTLGDPALGVSRTFMSDNQRKGVLFTNHAGYANPKVDDLFNRAAVAVSDAERKRLYSEVQKILVEDVAVAWLVEPVWPTLYNRKLRNAVIDALGPNGNFADAWLAR